MKAWHRYLRFWGPEVDEDIDDELNFHLERRIEEYMRDGLSREAAARAAQARIGEMQHVRAELQAHDHTRRRRQARRDVLNLLAADVRIGLRGFRRTPVFAVGVVAVLGLAIGMSVAMTTTFRAMFVRRLPMLDPDRVAVIWPRGPSGSELAPPIADLDQLRRASRTMQGVAAVSHFGASSRPLLDGSRALAIPVTVVTGNFFDVLGVQPLLGRMLRADDEAPGSPHTMVLSYGMWQSQFGADPAVVGRQLIDPTTGDRYTIVGVAPLGIDYPVGIGAWLTLVRSLETVNIRGLTVARLNRGVTIDAARNEYFALERALRADYKLTGATATSFSQAMLNDVRPVMLALLAAVALLLLIACVNVGNLFLVRATSRSRELAVRRAIGATYSDLVRQLVVESALLAAAGGVVGIVAANVLLRAVVAFAPAQLPRLDDIRLHGSVLGTTLGVTSACVLLFGVIPAFVAARVSLAASLRADARSGRATPGARGMSDWLVASQVAMALVLLSGAGVLTQSLRRLEHLEPGYRPDHVLIASLAMDWRKYDSVGTWNDINAEIDERIRAIPGVQAVSPMSTTPFVSGSVNVGFFEGEGQAPAQITANPAVPWELVGTEFFGAFEIPIVRGRAFAETDRHGAPDVVVVNETLARRFWPGENPVGKLLRWTPFAPSGGMVLPKNFFDWKTVVGVARDTRLRELRMTSPTIYMPVAQAGWPGTLVAVRAVGNQSALERSINSAVRSVDPTVAVWSIQSMDELLGGPLAQPRLTATLIAGFGIAAVLLAAIGLYGVMTSLVRDQTREIGIRIALGADRGLIRAHVLQRALVVAGFGALIGLGATLAVTRALRSLLFEVSPLDPVALVGAGGILLLVAGSAAYLPARRATRIDPIQALRAD